MRAVVSWTAQKRHASLSKRRRTDARRHAIGTNVALNRPASELTVQAVQREILQKNQRCNDGQAVDRDKPELSFRPSSFVSSVRFRTKAFPCPTQIALAVFQRCEAKSRRGARRGPRGVITHEPGV